MHGVTDAWRGGWRHNEADRLLAGTIETRFPGTSQQVREERRFLARAVTWAAERGIGQYVVAGAGIPAPGGNVHETARQVVPEATAVYAGADPLAVTWTRHLLAGDDPGVTAVDADYIDPEKFFAALGNAVDPARPACAILAMVLHATPPDRVQDVISGFAGRLASGSAVILSVPVLAGTPESEEFAALYGATGRTLHPCPPEMITGWLETAGLEIVPPGAVPVRAWPSGLVTRALAARNPGYIAGVMAVKPRRA
jgi:hypothetical protein